MHSSVMLQVHIKSMHLHYQVKMKVNVVPEKKIFCRFHKSCFKI